MSHFAKVESGIVTQVIVAEQEFVDTQVGTWVQTSYNTYGGQHTLGNTPLRKNYAGIGYTKRLVCGNRLLRIPMMAKGILGMKKQQAGQR